MTEGAPELPTVPNPAARWIKWLLAFGVSVAVGLAPLLGTVGVPGFRALLTLFPTLPIDTHATVVPLAAFLMGVVAVGVQFYAEKRREWSSLTSAFRKLALAIGLCTLALLTFSVLAVEHTRIEDEDSVTVLVGFSRVDTCKECEPGMSDAECLEYTSLDPGRIMSCWGQQQIRISFLGMAISYLVLLCCFGALVGVAVLGETNESG